MVRVNVYAGTNPADGSSAVADAGERWHQQRKATDERGFAGALADQEPNSALPQGGE